MAINKRLLVKPPSTGITPSEHFGVVLYEGDGSTSHSINGGKFGAGAYFNGSSSKVDIGTLGTTFENNFSFSLWFNLSTIPSSGIVTLFTTFEDYYCYAFIRDSDKKVEVRVENASTGYVIKSTSTFGTYGVWHHLAVTKSSSDGLKIYINGSLENTDATATVDLKTMNGDNLIGAYNAAGTTQYYLEGKIDQVRIFTKALSSSEVSTLYAETLATSTSLDPLSEDTTDTLQVLGDSSCIATYRFENNEDDLSGNYNLTGNEIQYAAGRYGQAASFNGSSSYAEITSSPPQDNSGVMSISFWAKTTNTSRAAFFIAEAPNPNKEFLKLENYGYQGTNSFRVSYDNNLLGNINNVAISDGNWHHIVITAGSGNVKTYKDNTLLATQSVTITDRTLDAFAIGYRKYNNDLYFDGEIDQFRIFNKELSASEVTTLYNENSLVASYRFEGNANDDTRNNDGTASNVTYEYGLNFTPDFVWQKRRDAGADHNLTDSTRGVSKALNPNLTSAEGNQAPLGVTSFDTGGFTVADNSGGGAGVNGTGFDYVAWCFKANGGTTSSNTDGSITSTVQVNDTAGFSIVKYTGNNTANATIGHGLSATPQLIISKNLSNGSAYWATYHHSIGITRKFYLNDTSTGDTVSGGWLDVSSTLITLKQINANNINENGSNFINYCFTEVEGFSKFGTYTGTNATGNYVETGFEPAFLIVKCTSTAGGQWTMYDNRRNSINPRTKKLAANSNVVENDSGLLGGDSVHQVNFLSNGFELLETGGGINTNQNTQTYIYMAFAADPDTEAPAVAKSFSAITYTGNGTSLDLDTGFKPGLIWTKPRSYADNNQLWDIVRGPGWTVYSNSNIAENPTIRLDGVSSFNDDGFSIGSWNNINVNGSTYVAWAWKADDNEPTILPNTELSSLISKYKFEDNVNDSYGDNNGTPSNLSYVSGRFGKAADFNGTSTKILYPQAAPFNDSNTILAISAWVKLDAASDEFVVMSASSTSDQSDYGLLIVGGNKPGRVFLSDAPSNANEYQGTFGSGNDTNWNHYVWQLSASGGIELWYNGTKQTRTTLVSNGSIDETSWFGDLTYATSVQWATGINRVVTSAYSNGSIDQMRLFNAELTSSEISDLYNEGLEALVSANANSGFSIVKYEGNGVTGTKISHGLSATPEMIIIKNLDTAGDWVVGHTSLGFSANKFLKLNLTNSEFTNAAAWASTNPTSTTFTLGSGSLLNNNGDNHIAYCFHSVSGYSKFGSYSGTSSSGNSVNVGFAPDWVLIKGVTAGSAWILHDNVRSDGTAHLRPNTSGAEDTGANEQINFTSTGFSIRNSGATQINTSGHTYIYAAFKIN